MAAFVPQLRRRVYIDALEEKYGDPQLIVPRNASTNTKWLKELFILAAFDLRMKIYAESFDVGALYDRILETGTIEHEDSQDAEKRTRHTLASKRFWTPKRPLDVESAQIAGGQGKVLFAILPLLSANTCSYCFLCGMWADVRKDRSKLRGSHLCLCPKM